MKTIYTWVRVPVPADRYQTAHDTWRLHDGTTTLSRTDTVRILNEYKTNGDITIKRYEETP